MELSWSVNNPTTWHPAARHASIFGITALSIVFSLVCAVFFEPSYFLPLTAAVVACSWVFGREGGLHATVVGAIMAYIFLMKPRYVLIRTDKTAIVGLFIFIATALLITWLTSSLRSSQQLQTSILEGMSDALAVTDHRANIVYMNPAAEALAGVDYEDARSRPFDAVFHLKDETTGESRSGLIKQVLTTASASQTGIQTILTAADGTDYSVEENSSSIRGRDGRINGAIIVLRNTTRRRHLQEQLTQSEKMEAISRLAGGVAGDFNNLLTVITGFGELLTSEMAPSNPLRRFAEEILIAADRAAELTRQLLAFRKNQSAEAKVYDLNALVSKMDKLLGRVLGPTVELRILPHSRSNPIKTDPGQMEQIVVNLAMNARDAMPGGGKFSIETSEVEIKADTPGKLPDLPPGQYAMLVVIDNGVGMEAEARARLFEPFYTTKMQGKGSGLGLSIVYGIVQQHNGHISVYSQPGAGTIFEIYFPRVKEFAPPAEMKRRPGPRGTETILIADDEEAVRKLVHAVLATHGYTVLEARDGREALELFEKNHARVDMVLTDVVMPNMSGYELGEAITKTHPGKKILFMSGFREAMAGDEYDTGRPFLSKPFTPEALLKQVRLALDADASKKSAGPLPDPV